MSLTQKTITLNQALCHLKGKTKMTITLDSLKKSRNLDFGNITKALSKSNEASFKKDDDNYFKLTRDKAGNGSAVIRFLPAAPGDELPWVQVYTRAFKGPTGRWYIENCRSTIGEDDPVNDSNRILYNSGNEKDKEIAKERKRKLEYHANILVISDPGNRANEGKVMQFKFGKKIWEKIKDKLEPSFEDEQPVNVFDLWEGANFKLRIRQYEGYGNYDQSTFESPSAVAETDEEILEIVNKQKPLSPLLDPKNFKSYADLKKKFESVISASTEAARKAEQEMEDAPVRESAAKPVKEAKAPAKAKVEKTASPDMEDEDDSAFFAAIAD